MSASDARWRAAARIDEARFERVDAGSWRGFLARELDAALRARILDDPDGARDAGEVLKDDVASRVFVRAHAPDASPDPTRAGGVVVKRFRYPDAWRAMRRAPRRSRARQAFVAALRLEALGIGVAEPLGFLEQRRLGMGVASWLLARYAPGRDAAELLAGADRARREALVVALCGVVAALQRARIAHGDLKATNFLVAGDEVRLLDLHAVARVGVAGQGRLRRDRQRFLRNLDRWPELRAAAAARLGA